MHLLSFRSKAMLHQPLSLSFGILYLALPALPSDQNQVALAHTVGPNAAETTKAIENCDGPLRIDVFPGSLAEALGKRHVGPGPSSPLGSSGSSSNEPSPFDYVLIPHGPDSPGAILTPENNPAAGLDPTRPNPDHPSGTTYSGFGTPIPGSVYSAAAQPTISQPGDTPASSIVAASPTSSGDGKLLNVPYGIGGNSRETTTMTVTSILSTTTTTTTPVPMLTGSPAPAWAGNAQRYMVIPMR